MYFLHKVGATQYQIFELVQKAMCGPGHVELKLIDHFNDDRGYPTRQLIRDAQNDPYKNGRQQMISECETIKV